MMDEIAASSISVWLVEDDLLYRRTLVDLLGSTGGVTVARTFGDYESALAAIQTEAPPDVILADVGLPGMSGTEGARRMKALAPATQIVMLTIHEDEDRIFDALCAGASGYLLKSATGTQILEAVRDVHEGGALFTPSIARKVLQLFLAPKPADAYGLTQRELEVLQFTAEGNTQRTIAERLHLSPHTVDTHLRNIYAKLHVHNGLAAVSKAVRERLIG